MLMKGYSAAGSDGDHVLQFKFRHGDLNLRSGNSELLDDLVHVPGTVRKRFRHGQRLGR